MAHHGTSWHPWQANDDGVTALLVCAQEGLEEGREKPKVPKKMMTLLWMKGFSWGYTMWRYNRIKKKNGMQNEV
jgi:hypothetical protein